MKDKYTIYPDGKNGKWKIVEMNNPSKVIKRGLTASEAREQCANLNRSN